MTSISMPILNLFHIKGVHLMKAPPIKHLNITNVVQIN